MLPSKCAHKLKFKKRSLRVQAIITLVKTATPQQLTAKLRECWENRVGSITEVFLLFVLGADPRPLYVENIGKEILARRVDDRSVCKKCQPQYDDFLEYAKEIYDAQFTQTSKRVPKNRNSPLGMIALTLDGGGIRGLVSVVTLLFASRRLFGDEYLPNVFNWMTGTSTGSMLALTLAKGASLTDAFLLYWEMKDQIFLKCSPPKRIFGSIDKKQTKNVEKVLEECFPDHYTFANCAKRLTVPALDVTKKPGKLHVFRNYNFHSGISECIADDVKFRDAARASSAAPTYFLPYSYKGRTFVDGSIVANCPVNVLFKELDQCNAVRQTVNLAAVISIGTGEPLETDRKFVYGSNILAKWKNLINVGGLLLEQAVGREQSGLESAHDRCLAQHIPFLRISPKGIKMHIDQINELKLTRMIWITLKYLKDNISEVDEMGDILRSVLDVNEVGRMRSRTELL